MKKIAWNKRSKGEIEEIVERLGYDFLDEYSLDGRHRKVIIQDSEGYKYEVDLNHLMLGKTPYFVAKNNPFTLMNISLWLKKENKSFVLCNNNIYKKAKGKLLFRCLDKSCGEMFDMSWDEIYSQGCGCPFRFGNRVGKFNNLEYLRPDLMKEWDYEKNDKKPNEYLEFSHKKAYWICSKCGGSWNAVISSRSAGSSCPKCADLQKESQIASELKRYFKKDYKIKTEYKIFKNPKTGYYLPYDIYILYGENIDLNGFYIEIHGGQHYRESSWHIGTAKKNNTTPKKELEYQKYKDKLKKNFAKKNGIYIEIDLRKIKTTEQAIKYIEKILEKTLSELR